MQYNEILPDLQKFYDQNAEKRDGVPKSPWKIEERQQFLNYLLVEKKYRLLEIGAGTGQDSLFFKEHGLEVISTDLSPAMVERCRRKGLTAYVQDFLHLDFPTQSFDAIYALNCLLHVPKSDFPIILRSIMNLLVPEGLFYLGVYGGEDKEGIFGDGSQGQGRFFSYYSNEQLTEILERFFEIVYFRSIELKAVNRDCFQSFILRKKDLSSLSSVIHL